MATRPGPKKADSTKPPVPTSGDDRLRTIVSYVGRIAKETSIDRLLVLLADMGRDLINADRCTVWLLNRHTDMLWSKVAHGVDRIQIPKSVGIAGCAATTGDGLIINDPYNDARFDQDVDKRTGYRTRSILALPIRDSEGTIVGVFQAINKMAEPSNFSDQDMDLLLVAATTTAHVLEAAAWKEEIEATQKEVIFTLSEVVEARSKETGDHIRRMAEYSYILARHCGLDEEEAELVRMATPLHDVGKVAIEDAILKKPGALTSEEWEVMKTHTTLGFHILKEQERKILKSGAIIAYEHHEKWDGTGYPRGLKGDDIHLYGRIVAMADVFDALGTDRVYKKAWEMKRILELFKAERGRHFDPKLVDVFFAHLDEFLAVKETYADAVSNELPA
jgi:HD-GYP domain-containing protein (c-di-GMP phosphodiesterase class II)